MVVSELLIELFLIVKYHIIIRLRLGAVLVIIGAGISTASIVVTALACGRIKSADFHPCSQKNTNNPGFPEADQCT